jgi:Uma2 family endonuclease
MSRLPVPHAAKRITYPTSDGKPMAETDIHRRLMTELIAALQVFYADEPLVYVSGNLLLFYEEGNRRRHISPDVFVVRGVPKHERENYLLWEEGQSPRFVVELTSSSTRKEDTNKKFELYRDVLKVREYFLFDPMGDYLKPSMQGWRLRSGVYHPIRAVEGRLPSQTTGLHLERAGNDLRLWNPETGVWLPTPSERAEEAEARADDALTLAVERMDQTVARADQAVALAVERADRADERATRAEAELRRLREQHGLLDDAP